MARISENEAGSKNMLAFLDMLAFSEIGEDMLADPLADDGYRILVGSTPGNVWVFTDYDNHPFHKRNAIQYSDGVYSSAAGRYQILQRFWPHYRDQLGLDDISPVNQDRYVLQPIAEQGATKAVHGGQLKTAIERCRNIWASLPGAGYNQREHSYDRLERAFVAAGGILWNEM